MSAGDKVRLSVRERQQLAAIQAMVEAGDPDLARTLTGHKGTLKAAFSDVVTSGLCVGEVLFRTKVAGAASVRAWLRADFRHHRHAGRGSGVVGALMVAAGLGLAVHSWQRRRDQGAPRRPVGQSVGD